MIDIFITLIIVIITSIGILCCFHVFNFKKPKAEAKIKINFIDFQKINFYNTFSLILKGIKSYKKLKITEKSFIIDIFGFKDKEILKGELILINSVEKLEKNFKIKIYKNSHNIINIKINNKRKNFCNSEIIFYKNSVKKTIKVDGFEYCIHNSKKRKRLLLYNVDEIDLTKIIKDNIEDKVLKNKAINTIKNNNNKLLLLLNIYISDEKSNILIFLEEEKSLIIPTKEEKKFFEDYYWIMYFYRLNENILDSKAKEYKEILVKKKTIFGKQITNLDDDKNKNIYFSFINQGINCILENNLISENSRSDYYFILGYILLFAYFYKEDYYSNFVNYFFLNMERTERKNYSFVDLMKIAISFTVFYTNNMENILIHFSDELKEDSPYKNGFEFFKDIIVDLNEDSDLIFIYLQINSGYGEELIDKKRCYKLSMISVEDIKTHIIKNIPRYFYTIYSYINDFIATDARTQVMIFNEKKIFDKNSVNRMKNNTMNVTIGMFHESGHIKFHMNNEVGGDRSPLWCVDKKFEFTRQFHWNHPQRGESGKFIDHFLYNSNYQEASIILIDSKRTNELMQKSYFTGDLKGLNNIANNIISNNLNQNMQTKNINTDENKINEVSTLSSKSKMIGNSDSEEYNSLVNVGCDVYY